MLFAPGNLHDQVVIAHRATLLVVLTACGGQTAAETLPVLPMPTLTAHPPTVTPMPRPTPTLVPQPSPPPTDVPPTPVATAVRASTAITITDAGPVSRTRFSSVGQSGDGNLEVVG